jgi:hypothetical protein
MTTDTALGVTKLCVQDGKKLDEIKFVDHPTIKFPGEGYENESVEMPFRYVVDDKTGEPILPEGMREHLRLEPDPHSSKVEYRTDHDPPRTGTTWTESWTTSEATDFQTETDHVAKT